MSASNKKKLRNELNAQKLTERQLQEQKEAKKLKLYTTVFVVVLALLVVIAAALGISKAISKGGVMEHNTVAVTIGEHELSNAELNYFYVDSIVNYYSQISQYAAMFGLDITKPLDEQVIDEETGETWADSFVTSAISDAKTIYAIADAAKAAGYELSESNLASIDNELMYAEFNALYSAGYPSMDSYLKAMYGNGATKEGYREYLVLRSLAGAYYNEYSQNLTYADSDLLEAEKENYNKYSSYTFNYKYILVSNYLEGGTTNESGSKTYSDDEKAAAQKKAEEVANSLIGEEITSVEAFNQAIGAMEGAKEGDTSISNEDVLYSNVSTAIRDWVTSPFRKAGDKNVIAYTTTSTIDGQEVETVTGYYAIYFTSCNDNTFPLANVRHILVKPMGGTYNSTTGLYDYSEEEMAAAMDEAKNLLNNWKANNPTEESFAALANDKSDDGDGTTGGLYKDVYPGEMVESFNDWCFEEGRKAGDVGLIESQFGVHIMYYVGDSETSYREHMITEELRSIDTTEWNNALVEAMTVTEGNTKYLTTDLILANISAG